MISRILFFLAALTFSSSAYADTYWFKGNKVKDKDGTEYLIFYDEHKVQLGFKVDGLNLVPIKEEIKKREEAAEKEVEQKEINNFINNLLKLSLTLLGILATIILVGILSIILWLMLFFYLKFKKY